MLFASERAIRASYPAELKSVLSVAKAEESRQWLATWNGIKPGPTPLYALGGLAEALGVARVLLKDESVRSALGNGGLKFALAIIRPHLDTISASRTSLRDRSKKVALVSRLFCGVVGCQGQPGEGIKLGTRCGWAGL